MGWQIYKSNGQEYRYYVLKRKVGMRQNNGGVWRPYYKVFKGKTKKEAEAKYNAYMSKNNHGIDCFGKEVERYITEVLQRSDKTPGTIALYSNAYNAILKPSVLAGKPLQDIKPLDLQQLYNHAKCGATTVINLHKLLSGFFKYASANGLCNNITAADYSLPKPKPRKDNANPNTIEVWEKCEIEKILNDTKAERLHFLLVLLYYTGLRIGEALALKYSDFDLQNSVLKVNKQIHFANKANNALSPPKTKHAIRTIGLHANLIHSFEEHKKRFETEKQERGYKTDFVFTTCTGKLYDQRSLPKTARRIYKKIGVPYKPFHTYRHTFGTVLAENGAPLQEVARLMGHSSTVVTAKYYIEVSDKQLKNAVSML